MLMTKGGVYVSNLIQEKYAELVRPAMQSKLEEFKMLGYPTIKSDEIWDFLHAKKWKRTPELALHKIVNDIIVLKAGEIINYQTVEAIKAPSLFLDQAELEALLKD